ncbi:hypothetical protein ACVIW0_002454 [Bradyrhizobium sp. USDA 4454]
MGSKFPDASALDINGAPDRMIDGVAERFLLSMGC